MKREGYLRLKLCVHPIFDYADTHNSHFKIDYLHENKTVCDTVVPVCMGAQVEYFKQKMGENLVTLTL